MSARGKTPPRTANRERLQCALGSCERVRENPVVGPSAYQALLDAEERLRYALGFALDEDEQDGVKRKVAS